MTDPTASPAFAIATPFGPATLTLFDRDSGVVDAGADAGRPLTVNRIAYGVRLFVERDGAGRLGCRWLHAHRAGDRWAEPTPNVRHKLHGELLAAARRFEDKRPEAFEAAERAAGLRRARELEQAADRLEREAAEKRAGAVALREAFAA